MTKATVLVAIATAVAVLWNDYSSTQPSTIVRTFRGAPEASSQHDDRAWEPLFFKALEERIRKVHLPSLRTKVGRKKDVEVRFWYDASPDIINGFVIRRSGDRWSASGIRQVTERWPSAMRRENLGEPKSGWDSLWKRLARLGLLTLPDSSATKCESQVLDGGAFVVELSIHGSYRTYRYANPNFAGCEEGNHLVSIESVIADEFRLHPRSNRSRTAGYRTVAATCGVEGLQGRLLH